VALETYSVILDLSIVIVSAFLVSAILARLHQPLVLGYLIAGILIGPYALALVGSVDAVNLFAELGIILLLFYLGLNFDLNRLRGLGFFLLLVGTIEMLLMIAMGNLLGVLLGWPAIEALLLGAVLAFSSTAIIVKMLEELDRKITGRSRNQEHVRFIIGFLLVEDIGAVVFLTLLGGASTLDAISAEIMIVTIAQMMLFFFIVLVLGIILIPRLIDAIYRSTASSEALLLTGLGICFGLASLSAVLGFSHALGAFIAGALIAESKHHASVTNMVLPVRDLFAAIFFLSIGMLFDPFALVVILPAVAMLVAFRLLTKVFACGFSAYLWGLRGRSAVLVGVGMVPIGEFSFISAKYVVDAGLVGPSFYTLIVGSGIVTVVLAMPLMRGAEPVADGLGRLLPERVLGFVAYLASWLQEIHKQMRRRATARDRVRHDIQDIVVNVLVIIVIAIVVLNLGDYLKNFAPPWLDVVLVSIPLTLLLSLPSCIIILRRVRDLMNVLLEMLERRYGSSDPLGIRKAVMNLIFITVLLLLSLLFIPLLAGGLEGYDLPILTALAVIIFFTAVLSWRTISRFQASLEDAVRRTMLPRKKLAGLIDNLPDGACQIIELASPTHDGKRQHLVCQIPVPADSYAVGRSLADINLEKQAGVSLLSLERGKLSHQTPARDTVLQDGDVLLVLGRDEDVNRAYRLLHAREHPRPVEDDGTGRVPDTP